MISATIDETSVPKMKGSAPKLPLTGSHSCLIEEAEAEFGDRQLGACNQFPGNESDDAKDEKAQISINQRKAWSLKRSFRGTAETSGLRGRSSPGRGQRVG